MKRLMSFVFAVISLSVLADSWTDPETGITWTYEEWDGLIYIGSKWGFCEAIPTSTHANIVVPSKINGMPVEVIGRGAFCQCNSITSVVIPEGVSAIYEAAFSGCNRLKEISIPTTLTYVEQRVFDLCDELETIRIDDLSAWCKIRQAGGGMHIGGCQLFLNGKKLESLVVPDDIESLYDYAFDGVAGLKTAVIPSSVTNIGYKALCCPDLEFVCFEGDAPANGGLIYGEQESYADRVTTWIREGSKGWGIVPGKWCDRPIELWDGYPEEPWKAKITEVAGVRWRYYIHSGNAVVLQCLDASGGLEVPEFLDGYRVSSIADDAFAEHTEIVSIKMPESILRIGKNAFRGCVALSAISIPTGVTCICDGTFSGCRKLESVEIPDVVTSIGKEAFQGCKSLKKMAIPDGVETIGDLAFSECGFNDVQIPSKVWSIGSAAFAWGCLSSVTISDGVTKIGERAFVGNQIEAVYVDNLLFFGQINFADDSANPLYSGARLYVNGQLVEETVKVTFDLGDDWGISAFYDENSEWGFVREKTIEVGIGRPVWPPEVSWIDGRYEISSWDVDLCCVMGDTVARPIYGGADINAALYSLSYSSELDPQCCSLERMVYDVSSGCIRAQGMVETGSAPLGDLDSVPYGQFGEEAYANLRIRLVGIDEWGNRVCCADAQRYLSDCGFAWSCALKIDTNEVLQIDVALISTWYKGECSLRQIPVSDVDHRMLGVRRFDLSDLRGADYGSFEKRIAHNYSSRYEDTITYFDYQRVLPGEKCETVYEFSDCQGISGSYVVRLNEQYVDASSGTFVWMTDYASSTPVTNRVSLHTKGPVTTKQGHWQGYGYTQLRSWDEYTYLTLISVSPHKYLVRFDLMDCGDRVGGGELMQKIDGDKGESEVMPIVEAHPHCRFLCWKQDHWDGNTLVYVAEYDREYVIAYADTKGVANPNPTMYTKTNEVVFTALADTEEYKFSGWEPTKIEIGTTGDVTVVALWRPIKTAEIVGAWSEPQTFEYDGKAHGVDYSAHLDVMDWPLNVVTQGTIRAVNVGEYAATAMAETVGVPETDTVYYRCAPVTNECKWTITTRSVTKLQIAYVSTAMIANGQQQRPQIVVRDVERGVVLTSADYALAYENNVEPGMGVARITGRGNYGGETTIAFPIVARVSPAEGLNMDGGTFEIVGETDWVADNVVTHDGYASMRSGAIGDNETSTLTAVVHGAGTVSFWWKVSSQHFDSVLELDRLEFYVDGVRQKWVNGDVDWSKLSFKVDGAGPHELKWIYAKDGSISERQDCGWVDEVSWEKEWLIGDWLNDVDREFATSNVKWMPDATVSSDDVGSMRSGACQWGERSVLSMVVENVGTLTFKWKCSCVAYGTNITDKLSLLIDGTPVKDADGKDIFINGETGWSDVSYRITGAGRHEVQWVFEKVSDASMGQNCGWVDVVRWDNEPGTLTDEDLVVDAFDGTYDGQGHGAAVSVKGVHGASVKYGTSREAIGDAEPPTFVNCGEHEVWFAVNVPDFNEYVGKMVVRIRPRSIETGEVTLGEPLVYTGSALTQTVSSVVVDGLAATFEVSDNAACAAGSYQLMVTGIGNFCGELSVPFAVAKAQTPSGDVTVEDYSPEAGAVEFTYDGEAHQPTVVAGYDGAAVVRFALAEEGPYVDALDVSNAVERLDVWYEISSANYERLIGRTQMTIRPKSIAGAEVVLGEQVSDVEGHVVQQVDSVIVNGLPATFVVSNNVATAEGDFELTVVGTGNFTGEAKCPYSVGGVVLPPLMTPGDGTIFTDSLIVRFSAQTPDSKWYYTLDGSMPTTNSLKASRVNLHGKTTIRAIAVLDGKLRSAVVEAHYALGACENPTVRLDGRDGCVFQFPGQLVVIDRNGDEGVVRYTLDGSEPTAESPAYEGPFVISASTTVKAKTFSDIWFDSETVNADMRLEVLSVPSPVIRAASEYKGTRTTVSMSCALEGAIIRYTLDGSEPTATSAVYEKPFEIGGEVGLSIQIMARAFRDDYEDSPVAEAAVTRVWGIGDTLGVPDLMFATDGWMVDSKETFDGRETMRSGPTDDGESNALETVVHGGGTISFAWRTSCEDSSGDFIWDRAEFWVDEECVAKVEGETSWNRVEHVIPDDGADHVLRWLYVKDPDLDTAEGEDCAWLAALSWGRKDVLSVIVVDDPNGKIVLPPGKDISEVEVKVLCNGSDIFPYLNLPAAENGVIDLAQAMVKDEIVKEPLDTTKGAKVELSADNPKITTAPTKPGLTYTLREGETLDGMKDGDSTVGDGQPWSPEITVKGGNSAFYSIGVDKGE